MPYDVNPAREQQSIIDFLQAEYPHTAVIPDGLLDDDNEAITYNDAGVVGFIVLYFSNPKPSPGNRGKSFAGVRLDQRHATVDVVAVARSGTAARNFLNDIYDRLLGFQTDGGGRLTDGTALWADSRQVAMDKDRPTRWARTVRFDFGVNSKKVE